ncbi:extracellular solute-binding protein [Candidatus Chloroploca sp. Khr17]|uniref:sugar ABC transporter substrate-binding protein n=1 Tax=Candidatus Chloroploca sp. Khr17 TaxID=2496869 RepID=UPI00101C276E|nr:extracellular solute-binding protein [Candidatus Chloroploca sp. Khr17]
MKFLRTIWLLLLAMLLAMVATGCVAPPLSPEIVVDQAREPSPTPTLVPRPAATPLPTRVPPTLTPTPTLPALSIWVAEEGPALATVQALFADLAQRADLELEVVPRPPDGLRLSIATASVRGEPLPDLIWGHQEDLAGLLLDGHLQPVPDALRSTEALPAVLTTATYDGRLWGVPVLARNSLLLLYNRELIEAAPSTSDELIVRARAARNPMTAGLVMAWTDPHWVLPWLHAFGGAPTDPTGATITLNTPAMTATLNLMRELYTAAPTNGDSYARGQRLFAQEYAAFAIDGDWALPRYRAVSETLELGIAPLPMVPATGKAPLAPLGGTYLMVTTGLDASGLAEVETLAALLSEPEVQLKLARDLGRLPAQQTVLAQLVNGDDPALAAAARHAAEAPGLPPTQAVRCALYGINAWMGRLLDGTLEVNQAPLNMQREAEACLSRF